jgi:anti-sigma-K factor RskA
VPSPVDPHDPRFELDRQDNLVLLALGESVSPEFELHHATCEQCQQELAGYTQTVQLARESDAHRDQLTAVPPPSVWSGITAQLGPSHPAPATSHAQPGPVRRTSSRWRYGLLAAAAAVVVAAAGVGGYLAGRSGDHANTSISTARLAQVPNGGPRDVSGNAMVHSADGTRQLTITTSGLPLRQGYYEVWLFNPTTQGMTPVGTLGDHGGGTFTIPAGIDLRDYHVIDVSAQEYGGATVHHGQSVLQGPLTQ